MDLPGQKVEEEQEQESADLAHSRDVVFVHSQSGDRVDCGSADEIQTHDRREESAGFAENPERRIRAVRDDFLRGLQILPRNGLVE